MENDVYLVQIISVFICISFTQGYNHDFIFAEEKSMEQMINVIWVEMWCQCDVNI